MSSGRFFLPAGIHDSVAQQTSSQQRNARGNSGTSRPAIALGCRSLRSRPISPTSRAGLFRPGCFSVTRRYRFKVVGLHGRNRQSPPSCSRNRQDRRTAAPEVSAALAARSHRSADWGRLRQLGIFPGNIAPAFSITRRGSWQNEIRVSFTKVRIQSRETSKQNLLLRNKSPPPIRLSVGKLRKCGPPARQTRRVSGSQPPKKSPSTRNL